MFGIQTSYHKIVTTSGTPPKATIAKSEHRLERINAVFAIVIGTSPTTVSYRILDNGDVEIYTGAAATVDVWMG